MAWDVDNSRLPPSRHPIQVRPARHAYLLVTIGPLIMPDSISPLVMPDLIGHLPQPTTKQKVQPPYLRPSGRVWGISLPDGAQN